MSKKRYIICILLCYGLIAGVKAQDRITFDPDSASTITTDISHFWQAFDLLKNQRATADSLKIIKTIFVDQATEGLRQYMKAANCTEKDFLETIRKRKADYLAIRTQAEAIAGKKRLLLQYFKKFKQLYPSLQIPSICITIGKFEVGGSQFENTLYIGCEVDILHHVDIIPQTIHELAHFQQKYQNPLTNLDLAMIEGGAEFMCFKVTGQRTIPLTWEYGIAHEKSLWNEFKPGLDSAINAKWFMDVPNKDGHTPGSLAYFIGFKICEAYLAKCPDKKLALQELCAMADPKKIFAESLYNP